MTYTEQGALAHRGSGSRFGSMVIIITLESIHIWTTTSRGNLFHLLNNLDAEKVLSSLYLAVRYLNLKLVASLD